MKRLSVILIALVLTGCDSGPEIRKNLAQCELNSRAGDPGNWNDGYLATCMQAKGYVTDDRLESPNKAKCGDQVFKAESADCYREDGIIGGWLAGTNSN
jgi:hypothetical protein